MTLIALLSATLAASLLGSLHCAAMCGGFAAMCSGGVPGPSARRDARRGWLGAVAYNGGRLVAYLGLGAGAGFVAGRVDAVAAALVGVQHLAAWALVAVLVLMAVRELRGRTVTVGIDDPRRPGLIARLRGRIARLLGRPGAGPAVAVGLLSALLPCGWLWSFVAVAGTTGEATSGAAVMAVFWLGTVPALAAVGGLARLLGGRARRYGRRLQVVVLSIAAGVALAGKLPVSPLGAPAAAPPVMHRCH